MRKQFSRWQAAAPPALLVLLTISAAAQSTAPKAAAPKPRAGRPAAAARTAAPPVPSVSDLRFPPLKEVEIPNVATYTLPNGIRLYLLEDHELPIISGRALVRTGNLFDPPDKVGLATITGQVMRSGGGKTKTGEQWNEELENMAASVEASIGESSGSASFSALKENVDPVLSIFKEVLTAPEFRQDQIDLAKMRIRSGISRRNDDPAGLADREFTEILYGKNTPYGWREEYATIDRITRADLQAFHQRYFFPKNVMLAVWGDFDTASMKAKIEQLFDDWSVEQPPVPPFPKVVDRPAPGVYLASKKDVTQTFFEVGQLGGELRDKDYPALQVMADILGGGFQSRLFQRVRTKMGDAYNIGAQWGANYDHPGLFQVSGSTKSISTVETVQAIREEVERIRSTEVSEDELRSARETSLNSFIFAFDTKTKTLSRMLTYEYFGYPKDFIQQYRAALAAVTRADVLRVAKERLRPEDFTIVAVGNPASFDRPLSALGPVREIDLTIPQPETAPADPAAVAKGRQMLHRAQQAIGGAEKLAAVRDFSEMADVRLDPSAGGMQAQSSARWIAPEILRQDQSAGGQKISVFWDGSTGRVVTPQGSGPLAGAPLQEVQGDLFRLLFRLLLSDRIQGRTVVAVDDQTIEITGPSGESVRLLIDPTTGMPRGLRYRATNAGGATSVEESWSDFRDVDGIKLPYKTSISRNDQKFADVLITGYKINSGLKPEELQLKP